MTRVFGLVLALVVLCSAFAFAEQSTTIQIKNVVPDRQLTIREQRFLATIPSGPSGSDTYGLREACRQMLLVGIIHVPADGKYRTGDATRYWSMYQVWTAPQVVTIPVIQGPPGPAGPQGPPGELGPPGQPEPVALPPTWQPPVCPLRLSSAPDLRLPIYTGEKRESPPSYGFIWLPTPGAQAPSEEEFCPTPGPGEKPIPGVTGPPVEPPVPPPAADLPGPGAPPEPPVPQPPPEPPVP